MTRGYVHVYTGNGKGKTTAALGLALRNVCAGGRVYFGQFIKGMDYSELKASQYLEGLDFEQHGRDCFIHKAPEARDLACAQEGLERVRQVLLEDQYDLVVLDEINVALFFQLFSLEDVLDLIDLKPARTELVLTGRYAPQELIDRADLVTEMKEVKHYYEDQNVEARLGIEK